MLLDERQVNAMKNLIMDEIKESVQQNFKDKTTGEEFEALVESFKDAESLKEIAERIEKNKKNDLALFEISNKLKEINDYYVVVEKGSDWDDAIWIWGKSVEEIEKNYNDQLERDLEDHKKFLAIDSLKVPRYLDYLHREKLNTRIEAILSTLTVDKFETLVSTVYEKLGNIDYIFSTE